MTNFIISFIIGAIFAIAALLLCGYIMDRTVARKIREDLGEDFEICYMPKSKMDIKNYVV